MERTPALVLGIGNLLWADEGFGVRCVEALHRRYQVPDGVTLMDGGTQGLYLVNAVCDAERLLVLDAIDFGDPPGTMRVLHGDEVPRYTVCKKMSLHQVGFQDVLAAAEMLGKPPDDVVLVGVQPAELEDYGGSLSPTVAARLDDAVRVAVQQLVVWGYGPEPRHELGPSLVAHGIDQRSYEELRPSEDEACRIGDPRLLRGRVH